LGALYPFCHGNPALVAITQGVENGANEARVPSCRWAKMSLGPSDASLIKALDRLEVGGGG